MADIGWSGWLALSFCQVQFAGRRHAQPIHLRAVRDPDLTPALEQILGSNDPRRIVIGCRRFVKARRIALRIREPRLRSYFAVYTWMSVRQDRLDPVRDVTDERIPIGGTPGFATLNLRCGRNFGACDQHRLSLSLENITDQPYLVHGSGVLDTGFTARFRVRSAVLSPAQHRHAGQSTGADTAEPRRGRRTRRARWQFRPRGQACV